MKKRRFQYIRTFSETRNPRLIRWPKPQKLQQTSLSAEENVKEQSKTHVKPEGELRIKDFLSNHVEAQVEAVDPDDTLRSAELCKNPLIASKRSKVDPSSHGLQPEVNLVETLKTQVYPSSHLKPSETSYLTRPCHFI